MSRPVLLNDVWTIREQLCLASCVERIGANNWSSVSKHMVKHPGEKGRDSEFYSVKNCAEQYTRMVEGLSCGRRKRSDYSLTSEPHTILIERLRKERAEELKNLLNQDLNVFKKLKKEMEMVRTGQLDHQLVELWEQAKLDPDFQDFVRENNLVSTSAVSDHTEDGVISSAEAIDGINEDDSNGPLDLSNSSATPNELPDVVKEDAPIEENVHIESPILLETSVTPQPHVGEIADAVRSEIAEVPEAQVLNVERAASVSGDQAGSPVILSPVPGSPSLLRSPLGSPVISHSPTPAAVISVFERLSSPVSEKSLPAEAVLVASPQLQLSPPNFLPLNSDAEIQRSPEVSHGTVASSVLGPESTNVEEKEEIVEAKPQTDEAVSPLGIVAASVTPRATRSRGGSITSPTQESLLPLKSQTPSSAPPASGSRPSTRSSRRSGCSESSPDKAGPVSLSSSVVVHKASPVVPEKSLVAAETLEVEQVVASTESPGGGIRIKIRTPKPSQEPVIEQITPKAKASRRMRPATRSSDVGTTSVALVNSMPKRPKRRESSKVARRRIEKSAAEEQQNASENEESETHLESSNASESYHDEDNSDDDNEPLAKATSRVTSSVAAAVSGRGRPKKKNQNAVVSTIEEKKAPLRPGRKKRVASVEAAAVNEEQSGATVATEIAVTPTKLHLAIPKAVESSRNLEVKVEEAQVVETEQKTPSHTEAGSSGIRTRAASTTTKQHLSIVTATPSDSAAATSDESSKRSSPATPASLHPPGFADAEAYSLWKKSLELVWKTAADTKYAPTFLHPVKEKAVPGYHRVIKKPMDLSTIKKNLESGTITTTVEFERDLRRMFVNAIMFNPTGHEIFNQTFDIQNDIFNHLESVKRMQGIGVKGQAPATETRALRHHRDRLDRSQRLESSEPSPQSVSSSRKETPPIRETRKRRLGTGTPDSVESLPRAKVAKRAESPDDDAPLASVKIKHKA